ncbi:hypothetical protein SC206_18980 [Rouxiella sp. T17]|uniref:hypothetical protein n=1 Tax=Rouxiella sp. T17 TaxID=3085684 RepID=UPI002FC864B9
MNQVNIFLTQSALDELFKEAKKCNVNGYPCMTEIKGIEYTVMFKEIDGNKTITLTKKNQPTEERVFEKSDSKWEEIPLLLS